MVRFAILTLIVISISCGPPPSCPGDATGNGTVDIDDIQAVVLDFGWTGTPGTAPNGGDVDEDGDVDIDDVQEVVLNFGLCPGQ